MLVGLANRDGTIKKVLGKKDLHRDLKLSGVINKLTGNRALEVYINNLKVVVEYEDYEAMKKFFEGARAK